MAHQQLTDLTPEQIAALAAPHRRPHQRVIYVAATEWSALLSAEEGVSEVETLHQAHFAGAREASDHFPRRSWQASTRRAS